MKKAPPQTPPGKHSDPRKKPWQTGAVPRMKPVGSADSHLLPPVRATNSGTINSSPRILRISRSFLEIISRRCRLPRDRARNREPQVRVSEFFVGEPLRSHCKPSLSRGRHIRQSAKALLKGELRLSKNPRRAREGRNPLELSIAPSGVYGGHGTIFAPENPIFQSKNRFLAVFAPGNLLDFSKNW